MDGNFNEVSKLLMETRPNAPSSYNFLSFSHPIPVSRFIIVGWAGRKARLWVNTIWRFKTVCHSCWVISESKVAHIGIFPISDHLRSVNWPFWASRIFLTGLLPASMQDLAHMGPAVWIALLQWDQPKSMESSSDSCHFHYEIFPMFASPMKDRVQLWFLYSLPIF